MQSVARGGLVALLVVTGSVVAAAGSLGALGLPWWVVLGAFAAFVALGVVARLLGIRIPDVHL